MRTRFSWVILLAILALVFTACNNGDDDELNWSDAFITNVYIGTAAVKSGQTVNVPLANVSSVRFELSRPVTEASLSQLLDYQITIENVDTGLSAIISPALMAQNGSLVWLDGSNKNVEFRLNHAMDHIMAGNQRIELGSQGDTFRVRVQFLIGRTQDGNQFSLVNDTFTVVWTSSFTS